MATKLILDFATSDDKTARFNYNYADPEVTTQRVKTLVATMLTNTAIFSKTLTAAKSAVLATTTETEIDLT